VHRRRPEGWGEKGRPIRVAPAFLLSCIALFVSIQASGEDLQKVAEGFKFKNPNPVFKPLPPEEEARLAPIKLGVMPKLDDDALKRLDKGDVVLRELPATGKAKRFEAIAIFPGSNREVMARLKDYGSFVGTMPNLTKLEFSWNGNMAAVLEQVKSGLIKFTFRVNILHYGDSVIEWEFVEGEIRDTSGYWKLFPLDDDKRTLAVYHVYSDPGIALPGFILDLITKSTMPGVMKAVKKAVIEGRKGK
jgi:hypothetical protein